MPTIGTFHTFYWEFSDTVVAPVVLSRPGYPAWQASVITPSLFGVIGAWIDVWMERWRWWKIFAPKVHRLSTERRAVLVHTVDLLGSPEYTSARKAVRQTATILGFNHDPWRQLKIALKDKPGDAENVTRHLEAVRRLRLEHPSTLTNPIAHLVIELAYDGFAQFPRVP